MGTWSYGSDGSAAQQPEGTEERHPQPSPSLPAQGSGQMGGFVLSGCHSVEISRVSLLQWSKDLCLFFSATTFPFVPFVTRHNIVGKERFVALGIV